MESPVQEDPYLSLGVGKDATPAEIKSSYRKLALRCHPDKVTDEALKKQSADEFHKIQQAYEILMDEEKRNRYDARARLAELKAEMLRRREGRSAAAASAFDMRPTPPSYPSFRSGQYEVRTPKFTEDYAPEPRSTTRKFSDAGAYVRRTSPQTAKAEEKKRSEKEDKARSERRRARDGDIRDSRDKKYYSSSEDVNGRSMFEEGRRKRDDVVKQREEAMRRAASDQMRHDALVEELERRRSEEARKSRPEPPSARPSFDASDYSRKFDEARRYQESANSSSRPQPVRTGSKDYYDARRSRTSRRRSPEIVEPPSLNKSATTGRRDLRDMVNEGARMPERTYSENVTADAHERSPQPPPMFSRSATMPAVQTMKDTSRKESKTSKPRPEVKIPDSGYSSPSTITPDQVYPTVPSTPKVSQYRYTPAADYMSASPDTYANPAPYASVETRTPKGEKERSDRRRGREGSAELPRPPMGASARTYSREDVLRRPSYTRASDSERDRDRDRGERRRDRESRRSEKEMLYAEIPSDYTKKSGMRSRDYPADDFSVPKSSSRDGGKDRDPYSRSGRDRRYDEDRHFTRPSLSRNNTIGVV